MEGRQTAKVYVDGLNLYRRRLASFPAYKWLNILQMCCSLLSDYEVIGVEYFTANLRPEIATDNMQAIRQQLYLRALATTSPALRIHHGNLRADQRIMPVLPREYLPNSSQLKVQKVLKVEEKGSDVNLAARMVADSISGICDVAFLLSNGSDHVGQIQILTQEFGRKVGLILPLEALNHGSKNLRRNVPSDLQYLISNDLLGNSQFDEVVSDSRGSFHRPTDWA